MAGLTTWISPLAKQPELCQFQRHFGTISWPFEDTLDEASVDDMIKDIDGDKVHVDIKEFKGRYLMAW